MALAHPLVHLHTCAYPDRPLPPRLVVPCRTEAEYRTLQSRRLSRTAARRGVMTARPLPCGNSTSAHAAAAAACLSSAHTGGAEKREGVLASTPYVDPWRMEGAMYRTATKKHWLSRKGWD
jgi:hypothetical protein